jgi:hypothetical protein
MINPQEAGTIIPRIIAEGIRRSIGIPYFCGDIVSVAVSFSLITNVEEVGFEFFGLIS